MPDTQTAVAVGRLEERVNTLIDAVKMHAEEQREQNARIEAIEKHQVDVMTAIKNFDRALSDSILSVVKRVDAAEARAADAATRATVLESLNRDIDLVKKAQKDLLDKQELNTRKFHRRVLFILSATGSALAAIHAWWAVYKG
jgi:hypothetical protein